MIALRRAATVTSILFLVMTLLVIFGRLDGIDRVVVDTIQAIDGGVLVGLAKVLAVVGSTEISVGIALVLAAFLWFRGYRRLALAPLALAVIYPFELATKFFIHQPTDGLPVVHGPFRYPFLWFETPGAYFSGHAARVAFWSGLGLPLLFAARSWLFWPLVVYLPVATMSRLILGEHWPSDVVGGFLIGSSIGMFAAAWSIGEVLRNHHAPARALYHANADPTETG